MNTASHFKTCPTCGESWSSFEEFLTDDSLQLNGLQASVLSPERSLFLLTHTRQDCGTTLSVTAGSLKPFAQSLDLTARAAGSAVCNRSCFEQSDLSACSVNCYMRWVRDLIPVLHSKRIYRQAS